MKKSLAIIIFLISTLNFYGQNQSPTSDPEQKIFIYGGNVQTKFVQYVIDLINKPDPKICFVPTASADGDESIGYWNYICKSLSIESHILKVWVSSSEKNKTFEETLLDMDAIIVGGGNTLNMLGIWKVQEIDKVLDKALKKGIILAGGSAGSICWFQNGISDSRPVHLSIVDGLNFLPYSHCAHYGDLQKKEMYHSLILNKSINSGYACDDLSGILFKNGKFIKSISLNDINHSYYVSLKNGTVESQKLESSIFINKDALSETDYSTEDINRTLKEFPSMNDLTTPLNAYISFLNVIANGQNSKLKEMSCYSLQDRLGDSIPDVKIEDDRRNKFLNGKICKVMVYKNSVAAVINKTFDGYYGLWYFFKENGKWLNAGEDMGGETTFESEIIFRENAAKRLKKVHSLIP